MHKYTIITCALLMLLLVLYIIHLWKMNDVVSNTLNASRENSIALQTYIDQQQKKAQRIFNEMQIIRNEYHQIISKIQDYESRLERIALHKPVLAEYFINNAFNKLLRNITQSTNNTQRVQA